MSSTVFTKKAGLLSSAVAAAAMFGAGAANADTSTDLTLTCPFPLIGVQTLQSTVTTNIPATTEVGVPTPNFNITAVNQIPADAAVGLGLVSARTLEGSAAVDSRLVQSSGTLPLPVPLAIEETTVPSPAAPFSVLASGQTPSLTFEAVDTIDIFVDDIVLDITARTADGSMAPAPLGEFTSDCTIEGGAQLLTSFDVVDPNGGGNDDPAELSLGESSLALGSVVAGQTSSDSVTITNVGDEALSISGISVSGDTAFSSTDNCTTLAADESCTVNVTFAPSTEGSFSGALDVATNGGNGSVALSGTGTLAATPELNVSGSLAFGQAAAGSTSTQSVTVANDGAAPLLISGVSLAGSSAFTQQSNCGSSVAAGSSCTVNVTYAAGAAGSSETGTLTIATNDGTETVSISGSVAGGNGGGVVPFMFDLEGTSTLAKSNSVLPLSGSIDAVLTLSSQTFVADLALDRTTVMIPVIKGFRKWSSTATIEFETVGDTAGSLAGGQLVSETELFIKVPKVTVPVFGFPIRIGGGAECKIGETTTIVLQSAEGETFNPLSGGMVTGTYDIPELEHCGVLTGLLNLYVAGENNTISAQLNPVL